MRPLGYAHITDLACLCGSVRTCDLSRFSRDLPWQVSLVLLGSASNAVLGLLQPPNGARVRRAQRLDSSSGNRISTSLVNQRSDVAGKARVRQSTQVHGHVRFAEDGQALLVVPVLVVVRPKELCERRRLRLPHYLDQRPCLFRLIKAPCL